MGLFDRWLGRKSSAPETTPVPALPRVAVRLRPIVPIPADRSWRSWIGGSPRLPESVVWPSGDAPLRFVAQIDCAQLPAELWLGAGPRHGWLVFFVGTRGGYVAGEVLHVDTLGPGRGSPAPWTSGEESLKPFSGVTVDWRREPPSWPVDVIVHPDGAPDPWRDLFSRWKDSPPDPYLDEAIDLARPEYQPFDWESLRALLDTLGTSATRQRESLARAVGDLARAQNAPPPNQARYERIRDEATAAAARFAALDAAQPWDADLWEPFARGAAQWRQLHFARDLENGVPLPIVATQVWHYATALVRSVPVYGPHHERPGPAAADLAAYQRLLALQPQYQARSQAMNADPGLPPALVGEGRERQRNVGGYTALREQQPAVWAEYVAPLRDAVETLLDIEVRLRLAKKPDMSSAIAPAFGHAWPSSRDAASAVLGAWVAAAERDATRAASPPPDRSEKITRGEATLAAVDTQRTRLAMIDADARDAEARGAGFAWSDWGPRIDEELAANEHRAIDTVRALRTWNDIRSALAARAYAKRPDASGIPEPALAYFLARWAHEAQFELPCMGGVTHGYTDLLDADDDTHQLLLELPESRLFGWVWGDVDDLIFAIALDALRSGEFGKVRVGVTNGRR